MKSSQNNISKITKNAYLTNSEYLIDTILLIGLSKNKKNNNSKKKIADNLEILNIINRDPSFSFNKNIGSLEDVIDYAQIAVSRANPKSSNPICFFTLQQKDLSYRSNLIRYCIFYYTYFYKCGELNETLPRTICIISQFACPGFFRELCMTITSETINLNGLPLEVLLTSLVYYLPPPMKSQKLHVMLQPSKTNAKGKESIIQKDNKPCTLYGVNVFPTFDFLLAGIFSIVDVQKFAKLYMLLFTSIDICIFSEKDEILNLLGNTLLALPYPFIFDSALEEYTSEVFFQRFMPPNSVALEKRIHILHGGYNKQKDKDRLKEIFQFVAVYDLDNSELFYLVSDGKKDYEEEKKHKKKIFEQIGNNKNKQVLIGPFIIKLEEMLIKVLEKSVLNCKNENENEDNFAWKFNDFGTTNKNFQDVCYSVNMWLLTLLLYHERQKGKDPKGQNSNQIYSFAFREKDLYKGEKEYFLSFIDYYKCFVMNLRKYFTCLEDERYKGLLKTNTNEKLTLIITEEISQLYSIYFNIEKQNKSNFSLKEKNIEELSLSILKEVIEEDEKERNKNKEKSQANNFNPTNQEIPVVDIYSIAESIYLVNQGDIDALKGNDNEFLEKKIITKCQEIIEKDNNENVYKQHEAYSKELFYGQISFQDISSLLERKILSEYRFKTELTDYLHLTLLIVLSMFVHQTERYEEILNAISKYHKLFLRKYLTLILEQYSNGLAKHPEKKNIKLGISLISTFIYNENIPKNEALTLYMEKPNIKAEKSKVKHKETKLKDETLKSVIKGIHKLELRENYCKDSIFKEDFVSQCYDKYRTKGDKGETCINCNGCGFQIKPKIYLKFIDDRNNANKTNEPNKKPPYKKIKCLVEPIQMIYEKSLALIGDTNIQKEVILHILVNLLFYYWKKVNDRIILQFIFDTIKNVEYNIELPNRYQM